ncbi:methionine--tRNA ligase [Pseudoclavibacter chungangensis]|uniref:Methionine--tRNA ligase n=1 Tax=Pseudoclavibacter chungangensis TaxID=587635 RepID=A0A7J5BUH7_9MICO|nr:methionine--tRNA ligase [Pseudoclavibacter chungangensis]KAB1657985.1 methionine--tRNA ligase [Pseudoclavibacter chungangensis]NYJ65858.1 methionyl-tRNA synthetase [Pseudoclavibacter chungangensis]
MASGDSFYVTSPIFYVNDVPHIGHAYTEVACDVLARWHRQRGDDTWFLTGTDEHGQKIMRSALANNVTPKEWADRLVTDAWKPLLETLDLSNDDFIRTTDERHESRVQQFVQRLNDAGFIYEAEFEALYCVGCEEFKPDSEIVDGTGPYEGEKVCAIHSKPLELLQEQNYFFKLSEFQDRLLALYEERPDFIQPSSARNEVVSFVRTGLKDLSISRTTFDWGVKVPWDPDHVVYVWFDALLNYVTAIGYGDEDEAARENFDRRWPATHIVGKDILRFHAVIWPAMLMAAGLEVPRRVFAHGWLLVGGEKMSKSKLTGIAPTEITDVFGSDAFRYYFMRAIHFGQDGSFSWEDLSARYHAELANGFGNLASRVIAMVKKYFDGEVPTAGALEAVDEAVLETARTAVADADAAMLDIQIHDSIASIWKLVDELNGYITTTEPWVLAKSDDTRERLGTVLATAVQGLGTLAVLLHPVLPKATDKLWAAIGGEGAVGDVRVADALAWRGSGRVGALEALFPRVEQEVVGAS